MKNGIHGAYVLYAETPQSIAQCRTDNLSTVTVNICNKGNLPTRVKLGFTDNESVFDAETAWIEYDVEIPAHGVIERSGIVIPTGYYLTAQSTTSDVSAQAWGFSAGTELDPITEISVNINPLAAGGTTTIDLGGSGVYSITSGSLPTGLTLSSAGVISGVMPTSGYNPSGVTSTATIQRNVGGEITSRTYTINKTWPDGSTPALAAPSARYIKDVIGSSTDGYYWVKLPGDLQGPKQVWCDMNTSGGGWMMLWLQQGGPQQEQDTAFYTVLNSNIKDDYLAPFRSSSKFSFGTSSIWNVAKNLAGVNLMKQYNIYNGQTIQDVTQVDTNPNGITHTVSSSTRQVYDLLDLGAAVTIDDIYGTEAGSTNIPLANSVNLFVDNGTAGGAYDYGSSDTLLCSGASRGFSNNGDPGDAVGGVNMQGWGGRHWIAYSTDDSATSILRCQYICWGGSEAQRLEIATFVKEDTVFTYDT